MKEIHVRNDGGVIAGQRIVDTENSSEAHRDAIQIIPHERYAGGIVRGIEVRNNSIESTGMLQGIFCSDGSIENGWITDNRIDTRSAHKVSVSMLSGCISNNRDSAGNLVPVQLFPMRIGGNSDGLFNVYILSFKDSKYQYRPTHEIVKDKGLDHVKDFRFGAYRREADIYLHHFDLDGFRAAAKGLTSDEQRDLALQFGVQDTENNGKIECFKMINIAGVMKGQAEEKAEPQTTSIDRLIQSTATRLEVEPEMLEALIEQESLKSPFYKGEPTKLFERHIFTQLLNDNGVDINKLLTVMPGSKDIIGYKPYRRYGTYAKQQERYELACKVSDDLAIGACSWGAYSVMGYHWKNLGLSSPQELAQKARTIEGQFELMIRYVEHVEPRALDAMKAKDFDAFKVFYNGPGKNDYAAEFAQKYRRALARNQPKKSVAKGKSRTVNAQTVDVGQKTVGLGGLFGLYYAAKSKAAELQAEVMQMGWQEWLIVALIAYMFWPNIRTFFTYMHDNGYLPRKNLSK